MDLPTSFGLIAVVILVLATCIAATQFGSTLASLALGWIGEPAVAHLLE